MADLEKLTNENKAVLDELLASRQAEQWKSTLEGPKHEFYKHFDHLIGLGTPTDPFVIKDMDRRCLREVVIKSLFADRPMYMVNIPSKSKETESLAPTLEIDAKRKMIRFASGIGERTRWDDDDRVAGTLETTGIVFQTVASKVRELVRESPEIYKNIRFSIDQLGKVQITEPAMYDPDFVQALLKGAEITKNILQNKAKTEKLDKYDQTDLDIITLGEEIPLWRMEEFLELGMKYNPAYNG